MRLLLALALATAPGIAFAAGTVDTSDSNDSTAEAEAEPKAETEVEAEADAEDAGEGQETNPPEETETVTECEEGMVFDEESEACVEPQDEALNDADRIQAVRELAYAGKYGAARIVLDAVTDQNHDMVFTYRGFTARKMGNMDEAMIEYSRALDVNPDNILVRSYMGQAFVETGQYELAQAQLSEIRARGGRGTWAEISLRLAIDSGRTYNY